MGGNYAEVAKRLPSESLVKRFITKFPDDKSFAELSQAMQEGDRARAFRAAHTLKGVCQSLGLGNLLSSTQVMTELLRHQENEIPPQAQACFEDVRRDYDATVAAIKSFLESCAQNPV